AIQDGKITRVGGARTVETDVRVVAATNRDLTAMIRAGQFREDLYFRLAVVPLAVPTLAERIEDVPALVEHFGRRLAARRGRRPKTFEPDALAELQSRRWPGNVRELQNAVERAVLMSSSETVRREDLPPDDPRLAKEAPGELLPGQTLADA